MTGVRMEPCGLIGSSSLFGLTPSFLGNALKLLCFMLLSRQDQLVNPDFNHQWNGGHRTRFCRWAAERIHHLHSFRFLTEDGGEYQNRM